MSSRFPSSPLDRVSRYKNLRALVFAVFAGSINVCLAANAWNMNR